MHKIALAIFYSCAAISVATAAMVFIGIAAT
jgi:hypothetical protein